MTLDAIRGSKENQLTNMKHIIQFKGIRYSKLSDRGRAIRRFKLRIKAEETVKAVSILVATSIPLLTTTNFA